MEWISEHDCGDTAVSGLWVTGPELDYLKVSTSLYHQDNDRIQIAYSAPA